jgi:uncharacterized protein YbaR (Trm112 family)
MTKGTCPVCNGTGRRALMAHEQQYKHVYSGYDAATDTLACSNCGAQYMFGRPTGEVRLNKEGQPCKHSYSSKTVGRCLTEYTCSECGDSYQIDSGD